MTERMNQYARAVAVGVLIAIIGVAAFGRFYTARFSGLVSTTAVEAAEVAHQLRYDHGMTTKVIHPLSLAYATPSGDNTVPQTRRAPLYPVMLSALFRVRGGGDASVAMFNGLMFLLTGWMVYVIGRMLWDRLIAILAVITYFISIAGIGAALSATGASLAGLFLMIGLWAALRGRVAASDEDAPDTPPLRWPVIAGAALGLAWLSGMTSLMLLIPLAVLATAAGASRWRQVAVLAVTTAIIITPWLAWNWHATGSPAPALATYELITHTQTYPGASVYRTMPAEVGSPVAFAMSHPREMLRKVGEGMAMLYRGGPEQFTPYLFPFFILGAFIFGGGSLQRSLWRVVVAMFALQALSISLWGRDLNGLQVLVPVGLCLSVAALVQALRRTDSKRWTRIAIGAVIAALVIFPTASSAILGGKAPTDPALVDMQILRNILAEDAVVATDMPAAAGWYAGLATVGLPEHPAALAEIARSGADPDYIYLSRSMLRNPTGEWARIAAGGATEEEAALMGRPIALTGEDQEQMIFVFERHEKRAPDVIIRSPQSVEG
ncbi:MAG: ArnT family glycosyltransferase [Armatimonadota bacterium]